MNGKWTISLTRRAKKDLADLLSERKRAFESILELEQNPHAGHPLLGGLRGVRSLKFSLPGGAYRVAYILQIE